MKSTPLFTTWQHKGVQFFASDTGRDWHIFDENGNNYGAWMAIDEFHRYQKDGHELANPVGKCRIAVQAVISTPV